MAECAAAPCGGTQQFLNIVEPYVTDVHRLAIDVRGAGHPLEIVSVALSAFKPLAPFAERVVTGMIGLLYSVLCSLSGS